MEKVFALLQIYSGFSLSHTLMFPIIKETLRIWKKFLYPFLNHDITLIPVLPRKSSIQLEPIWQHWGPHLSTFQIKSAKLDVSQTHCEKGIILICSWSTVCANHNRHKEQYSNTDLHPLLCVLVSLTDALHHSQLYPKMSIFL